MMDRPRAVIEVVRTGDGMWVAIAYCPAAGCCCPDCCDQDEEGAMGVRRVYVGATRADAEATAELWREEEL